MKTIQTIFSVAMFTLICGCKVGDGKVKYHFNPPMSYHTLIFEPVSLATSAAKTYFPREFFTVDKRFRAVRANLLLQSSQDTMTEQQATHLVSDVEVSLAVKDSSDAIIFSDSGKLTSLSHRIVKKTPLVISFGFKSPFDPTDTKFGSTELQIKIPEGSKVSNKFAAQLVFTEIRGK